MDILYSDSFSRNVAFNSLMFLPEISNRMVSVNGKHPKSDGSRFVFLKGLSRGLFSKF